MEINSCNNCKHYLGNFKCSAFPDGIDSSILEDGAEHFKPVKGQKNKIVFEKKEVKLKVLGLDA